jgi:hypothetical protein
VQPQSEKLSLCNIMKNILLIYVVKSLGLRILTIALQLRFSFEAIGIRSAQLHDRVVVPNEGPITISYQQWLQRQSFTEASCMNIPFNLGRHAQEASISPC